MSWQVTSDVSTAGLTSAELASFGHCAQRLDQAAADADALAMAWLTTGMEISRSRAAAWGDTGMHVLLLASLSSRCFEHALQLQAVSESFAQAAQTLIRAYSLYSEAEYVTAGIIARLVQLLAGVTPIPLIAGATAAAGVAIGSLREGRFNAAYAVSSTAVLHEGLVGAIAGGSPAAAVTTREVSRAAAVLAPLSSRISGLLQGDDLVLTRVHSSETVMRQPQGIGDALHGLQLLGSGAGGLGYATVAIQRFRQADGSRSWLVTIPGTDGHRDSPLGWSQNVELMSARPEHRARADGSRMVVQAMRQAGVQPGERVALVGHSQGGILAASLAADATLPYRIAHVVTAGSPIAGHPIPAATTVTSVEMDDDIVPALDAVRNPLRTSWVTVRGTLRRNSTPHSATLPGASQGTAVEGVADRRQLSHDMVFHRAAYADASALGSPALQAHESHFAGITAGRLEETTYVQGRLRRAQRHDDK